MALLYVTVGLYYLKVSLICKLIFVDQIFVQLWGVKYLSNYEIYYLAASLYI